MFLKITNPIILNLNKLLEEGLNYKYQINGKMNNYTLLEVEVDQEKENGIKISIYKTLGKEIVEITIAENKTNLLVVELDKSYEYTPLFEVYKFNVIEIDDFETKEPVLIEPDITISESVECINCKLDIEGECTCEETYVVKHEFKINLPKLIVHRKNPKFIFLINRIFYSQKTLILTDKGWTDEDWQWEMIAKLFEESKKERKVLDRAISDKYYFNNNQCVQILYMYTPLLKNHEIIIDILSENDQIRITLDSNLISYFINFIDLDIVYDIIKFRELIKTMRKEKFILNAIHVKTNYLFPSESESSIIQYAFSKMDNFIIESLEKYVSYHDHKTPLELEILLQYGDDADRCFIGEYKIRIDMFRLYVKEPIYIKLYGIESVKDIVDMMKLDVYDLNKNFPVSDFLFNLVNETKKRGG